MPGPSFRVFDRRAALAFVAAFAILLSGAGVADYRLRGFETALGWVDHTHEVIELLDECVERLLHAESAERGYLLSSNPAYRADYQRAAAELAPLRYRARWLTRDNPLQQRRLDTLEQLTTAKLAQLAVAVRRHDDARRAAPNVFAGDTLNDPLSSEVDALIQRMTITERTLLDVRAADRTERLSRLGMNIKLGAALALLIALFAAFRVQRAASERATAEHERDAKSQELVMQSGELSAQNEELIAQGEALQMAMDQAEGANEAKSVFLAQMSHELRTPLNSVIGFANIVRRNSRGALVESEITYLDRVVENGRHLLKTINSILDLSKIEANQENVELELVSLSELAREVHSTLETQAAAAQITLAVLAPMALASIVTDRDKLRRVLINLVANAVKFTKPGGTVTIAVECARRAPTTPVAIEVRDTGIGIAPNRLAAIFEAFEQGDVGVGREYGGTGLGLSISRALCRLLHYELSVSSTLGKGSVFRIALVREEAVVR